MRAANLSAASPPLGSFAVLLACTVAVLPALASFLALRVTSLDVASLLVALSAVFAVLLRRTFGISFHPVGNWRRTLSLTHTAFALGCIPAVAIVLIEPQILTGIVRNQAVRNAAPSAVPSVYDQALFVLGVSVWAGLTEEFIFRGLLLSVLRRWRAIPSQRWRDVFAVVFSAAAFGLAHLWLWGPAMSLAIMGLGLGLGVGYLAIGERLLPLIVYHIGFDVLSLTAALMMR